MLLPPQLYYINIASKLATITDQRMDQEKGESHSDCEM